MARTGYLTRRTLLPPLLLLGAGLAFWALTALPRGLDLSREKAEELRFDEMYSGASSLGIRLSDKLKRLTGKKVRMTGFMAPPLKPTLSFFVLTAVPLSICPFCSSDADWPADIVVVRLKSPVIALPFDSPIEVEGTLEVGSEVDEETGFVSLVRVAADELRETGKETRNTSGGTENNNQGKQP